MGRPKPLPEYDIANSVCHLGRGTDGTTWPWPFDDDDHDSAAWRARYAPDQLTRDQLFELASIANAYATLITHPCRSVRERLHVLHRVYEAENRKERP